MIFFMALFRDPLDVFIFHRKDVRGIIRGKARNLSSMWYKPIQVEGKGWVIQYMDGDYHVFDDYIHYLGRWKMPTLYYVEGDPMPSLIGEKILVTRNGEENNLTLIARIEKQLSEKSSLEFKRVRGWHVFTDIMNALVEEKLSQMMLVAIVAFLIIIGSVVSYFAITHKIEGTIEARTAPLYPTITATQTINNIPPGGAAPISGQMK